MSLKKGGGRLSAIHLHFRSVDPIIPIFRFKEAGWVLFGSTIDERDVTVLTSKSRP